MQYEILSSKWVWNLEAKITLLNGSMWLCFPAASSSVLLSSGTLDGSFHLLQCRIHDIHSPSHYFPLAIYWAYSSGQHWHSEKIYACLIWILPAISLITTDTCSTKVLGCLNPCIGRTFLGQGLQIILLTS